MRSSVVGLALVAFVGCGRDLSNLAGAGDALDGGNVDGGTTTGRCDPSQPFGTPELVVGLSGDGQLNPSLTRDESAIVYLAASSTNALTLMMAERKQGATFQSPVPIAFVKPPTDPFSPHLSDDRTTISYVAPLAIDGGVRYRIFTATRNGQGLFSEPVLAFPSAEPEHYFDARPVPDGWIFRADGDVPGQSTVKHWSGGSITNLLRNGGTYTAHPVIGGAALYFTTVASETYEMQRAVRAADVALTYEAPKPVGIDTVADESIGWVSPDECVLYYERYVPVGGSRVDFKNYQIFRVARPAR